MTVSTSDSSVIHDGNGVTTTWPYTFRIPTADAANVGLFDISTGALTTLDPADYTISGIGGLSGGDVEYPLVGSPIGADKRLVIWREVPYLQETQITNQAPFYPTVLELQLDLIVMQIQQLYQEANRSLKVTLGSELDPDAFIAQLQEGAAEAEASAAAAAASAAAAAASAASVDPANLIHVNTADVFTAAQTGQARANIDADVLAGFRNKIINGNFDIWQRGTSGASIAGYLADRWSIHSQVATVAQSRIAFAVGDSSVPDNPKYAHRAIVTSAGAASEAVHFSQKMERVQTLAGQRATATFYIRADAPKNIFVECFQFFGSGGTPSASVTRIGATKIAIGTGFQRYTFVMDIPSIIGKTLGTDENDFLQLVIWYSAGSDFNARTDSLGTQSGTFDISHVSVVPGDASKEDDPFAPVPLGVTQAICERYCTTFGGEVVNGRIGLGSCTGATTANILVPNKIKMRDIPVLNFVGNYSLMTAVGSVVAVTGLTLGAGATRQSVILLPTTAGGLVAGDATQLLTADINTRLTLSAEL